jgi:DNA-binding MltR family transcriptional regulator
MGAALLDGALEMLLRHAFVATSGLSGVDADWLLTGSRAPLLSMGVRARIARALGLIDSKTTSAVLRLIDIRNAFAHNTLPDDVTMGEAMELWEGIPAKLAEQLMASLQPLRSSELHVLRWRCFAYIYTEC